MTAEPTDVLVIGGGVVGLACAYRLAADGASVQLLDASGTRGASWAAAGMLAPVSEAIFGEVALTRLNLAAVPELVAMATELEARTGESVGLSHEGTLAVAFDADDKVALRRLTDFRTSIGLRTDELSGTQARQLEPYLAAGVRTGVLATDDLSIDNRQYLQVLRRACIETGVSFTEAEVTALTDRGAITTHGGYHAATVVLAAGALSGQLTDLPVHPVKGQILRLAVPDRLTLGGPVLRRTVRGIVRGSEIYLVPREHGEVVVGATSEQQGVDTSVTAGGVYELLRNAYELVPISSEFTFVEARAGLRPGTPDNGPIVGRVSDSLIVATGHYRNGILLSAMTSQAVASLVAGKSLAEEWKPFSPDRFRR